MATGSPRQVAIQNSMVTTAFELPGHRIVRSLGIVRGITVRSRSIVGMRYDATEVMAGLTEVLCYGTAVVVEASRDA